MYNEEYQKMQEKLEKALALHDAVMDLESKDSEHRLEIQYEYNTCSIKKRTPLLEPVRKI